MKNVSVKSGQKNTIPTIINFKNSNLVVHLLSFSLLKAHGALICKIHKAVLSSAGRAGCVKLIQESPSVYPYTAIPCTNSEITNDVYCDVIGKGCLRGISEARKAPAEVSRNPGPLAFFTWMKMLSL